MKRVIVLSIALGAAVVACDRADTPGERKVEAEKKAADRAEDAREADRAKADNTKKNERDVDTDTKTPLDQGENEMDRTITQKIRQGVMADDDLSMTAKNVKIITNDGVVTLRGPVSSEKERTEIVDMAQKIDGVKRVENQLEVAAK